MRIRTHLMALALSIVALVAAAGCTSGPSWDPQLGTVTSAQLVSRMESTDASQLKSVPVANARERRDAALAALRREDGGSEVADVLTEAFPQGNVGVPLFVGKGTFAGEPAIVVIEAYGAAGGNLDHKRLWILSSDGTPLYSSTSR